MANRRILRDIRINEEMDNILNEAAKSFGIKKSELARFLLNKSLRNLKYDSVRAGGYEKLEITLKKVV